MKTLLKINSVVAVISAILMSTFALLSRDELKNQLNYELVNIEYDPLEVDEVIVSADNRSLNIIESTSEKINIKFYVSDIDTYSLDKSSESVGLNLKTNWFQSLIYSTTIFNLSTNETLNTIEISVPTNSLTTLRVNTENGLINVSDLEIENLIAETKNGTVNLKNSKVTYGNLTSSNGTILLSDVESTRLIINTSNGEIKGDKILSNQIEARTSNGQIRLDNITSYNLAATTSNGNIILSINGLFAEYQTIVNTNNGNIRINDQKFNNGTFNSDQSNQVSAITSNGNIRLTFI